MEELNLKDCVVRVQSKDGYRIGGTGFIVAPSLIVTCAHVVRGIECEPGDQVGLSFFNNTHKVLATVEEEGWDEDQDVAFLRPNSSLPEDTIPAVLGPSDLSRRHQLESFGYPVIGDLEGIWIGGEIRGIVRDELGRFWLQLNAGVKPGLSGAPILDVDSRRVVGMISLTYEPADKLERFEHTAFAIPSETISSLRSESLSMTPADSIKAFSHLRIKGDGNVYGDQNQVWIDKSTHHYYLSPSIDCSEQISEFLEHYLERNYFGGRQDELDLLDTWLGQPTERNAILSAPVGLGKSALVTRWITQLQKVKEVDVVYHPISLRFGTHQIEVVLQSLVSQLIEIYHIETPRVSGVVSLRSKFTELLKDPPPLKRPVLVVVDGLDEMSFPSGEGVTFPQPSPGIHLLVTARTAKDHQEDDKAYWQAKLNWKRTPFEYLELAPLSKDDVGDIVKQANLERGDVERLAEKLHTLSEGYPLLIDLYLLRLTNDERLTIDSFLDAEIEPGLGPYIEEAQEVLRFADLQDSGVVEGSSFLGLLSAARGSLSIEDLQGMGIQTPPSMLREIVNRSRGLVIGDGRRQGFALSHPMINYVYGETAPDEVAGWKKQLVAYCERSFKQLMDHRLGSARMPNYVLEYYAEHLLESQWENTDELLFELICEEWIGAQLQGHQGPARILRDIDLVWERAQKIGESCLDVTISPKTELTKALNAQFRCALSRSSIVTLATNLTPLLVALLAQEQVEEWGIPRARAYANAMLDPVQRANTNLHLLEMKRLSIGSAFRSQIASEILQDLKAGKGDESTRCRMLLRLLDSQEFLSSYQLELARDIVYDFSNPLWVAWGLAKLISKVDGQEVELGILKHIIESCLKINPGGASDDFHYLPYLYSVIANNLPIHLLIQATSEVLSRSEVYIESKYRFFGELAWHISAEQAEMFMEVVHRNLSSTGAALILSRISPKLNDETALRLAKRLAQRYKAEDYWNRTFWYQGWNGCTPAFLILAHHRIEPSYRQHLLDIAQEFIEEFGEKEHPITQKDLRTLYRIVEGSCLDHEAAELILQEEFLKGYFTNGRFGLFSEELVDLLGPETLKAVLKPVTRKSDGEEIYWDSFLSKSGYFLPRVASRLSDSEWSLVYRIGGGRHEYTSLGYVRATAQNIARRGTPEGIRKEIVEWVTQDRYNKSAPDAEKELLQAIAPFVPTEFLFGDDMSYKSLSKIALMASNFKDDQARLAALEFVYSLPNWVASETRILEITTEITQHLEDRKARRVWLVKLLQRCASVNDLNQQAKLLSKLSGMVRGSAHRSVEREKTRVSRELKAQQNEELHQQLSREVESLKAGSNSSKTIRILASLISPPLKSSILGKPSFAVVSSIFVIFDIFENLFYRSRTVPNRLLEKRPYLSRSYKVTPRGILLGPDAVLNDQAFVNLQEQILILNQMPDSKERQETFLEIADSIHAQHIASPYRIFEAYVERAEEIWGELDEDCVIDALRVLKDRTRIRVFHPYQILIPPILLKRPDLSQELLTVLDEYPFVEQEVANYAIAGYFLSGEEQLTFLERAMESLSRVSADDRASIAWALTGMARYIPSSFVPRLLSTLSRYPSAPPLIQLAPQIASNDEWLAQAIKIASKLDSREPVHRFICALAPYLREDGIADTIKLVVDRKILPSTLENSIPSPFEGDVDNPAVSYNCLLNSWMGLSKDEMYAIWTKMLRILSFQPRENLLEHIRCFLPVVVKLGGEKVAVDMAHAVVEVSNWQWWEQSTDAARSAQV